MLELIVKDINIGEANNFTSTYLRDVSIWIEQKEHSV